MPRHALVIAIDGLRASALGAYGNTWHPTPALDDFASRSQLFDWTFAAGPRLEDFYQAVWGEPLDSLPVRLHASGVTTKLLTDDAEVAQYAEHAAFNEIEQLVLDSSSRATSIAETQLAQFFSAAIDELEQWQSQAVNQPRLLWLHSRGLRGAWDAPLEIREQLLDEDDPPASTFITPPSSVATMDHDELLLYRAAYAAQINVLDECLGVLWDALADTSLAADLAIVLIGARGYALGEHGRIGGDVHSLYSELVHLPLLIHTPADLVAPPRSANLMQPVDLQSSLLTWFGISPPKFVPAQRQFVISSSADGERIIRTPAWMLRQTPAKTAADPGGPPALELYAKPDDRWEANEIANRCPDVAERLLAVLEMASASNNQPMEIPPFDDDLLRSTR
jgi:hypothetical protein